MDLRGRSFSSLDEALQFMADQTDKANSHLAPQQAGITWGSHWIRFDGMSGLIIFGYVFTRDELIADERSAGAGEQELAWTINNIDDNHERGYLFSRCYSIVEPTGELGDTHRSNVWPITEGQFREAQAAHWHAANMPGALSGWLGEAFKGFREHILSIQE